jgi:hypothetical protein
MSTTKSPVFFSKASLLICTFDSTDKGDIPNKGLSKAAKSEALLCCDQKWTLITKNGNVPTMCLSWTRGQGVSDL